MKISINEQTRIDLDAVPPVDVCSSTTIRSDTTPRSSTTECSSTTSRSDTTETHRMIHYGKKEDFLRTVTYVERRPNDTCPWKGENKCQIL